MARPQAPAVADVLVTLEAWGSNRRWIGPDPYEGLNSPAGRAAPGRRGRQVVVQVYKRLPLAPLWPLSAPERENSKVLGLVISGYAALGADGGDGTGWISSLASRLRDLALAQDQGVGWGYPFDVQTRNLRYTATSANAIATSFVVNGLLDAHRETGVENLARLALDSRPYLLSLLCSSPHGPYFAYLKKGSDLVHNANLLVCGTLARLHRLDPEPAAEEAAVAAATTTINLQRGDGLWVYGEAPNFAWIDNFHTAYTLEGLAAIERQFGLGGEAIDLGARAWLDTFIDQGGWARYFHDRLFPLETHCCASAIDLLCDPAIGSRVPGALEIAQSVADRAIAELWIPARRSFAFSRTRRGLNRREFMRWTNAPMFRALSRLQSARAAGSPGRS